MKKERAPDLTDEIIKTVLETLDDWKGKLTWDLLRHAVEEKTGILYSRFTLGEYPEVANAFTLRKKALSGTWKAEPSTPRDEQVRAALEQVARYRTKVERLQQENDLLHELFVTWATNAEQRGTTMAMLNAPLRKPPRDQSKGVK